MTSCPQERSWAGVAEIYSRFDIQSATKTGKDPKFFFFFFSKFFMEKKKTRTTTGHDDQ